MHSRVLQKFPFLLILFFYGCAASGDVSVSSEKSPVSEEVQEVRLYIADPDLDRLFRRNPRNDDRVPGYARWGEGARVQGLNGVRFRGNTSRYHPKKSYNIRFSHPQAQIFNGDRLNLNAMYTDPSGMRERIAWQMFAEVNQPASKTRYFALYINDYYEGLGIHIQRVDDLLLRQNGLDPNGTLVRDMTRRRGTEFGLQRRSAFGLNPYQQNDLTGVLASLFDSRWTPNYTHLTDLIEWVYDTPAGDDFEAGFDKRIDTVNFIDWLAIHYIIGDVDAFGDDYWLYRGRGSDDKWKVLPWDHDLSFGRNERDGLTENRELGQFGRGLVQLNDFFAYEYPLDDAGWDNALITKFHATPGLRHRFESRMLELIDTTFSEAWFRDQTDTIYAVIESYMNPDQGEKAFRRHLQQHHGELGRLNEHRENLLDFIELRYAFIRKALKQPAGNPYHATRTVSESGERILFTDAKGWTLGVLDVESAGNGSEISVHVSDSEGPIRKKWNFETSGDTVTGVLTIYYRNDISPDGKENWYHLPEAIGNQRGLIISGEGADGQLRRNNPYSNKVSVRVQLEGNQVFELIYGD